MADYELYRERRPNFRSVRVEVTDTELRFDTHDMGPATEEFWGDSDYEFWTVVLRASWPALLRALAAEFLAADRRATDYDSWRDVPGPEQGKVLMKLAKEFYSGDSRATDHLADLCKKHDVPYSGGSWV